jgi:penicillin-insensitive murein DD-endopeptidase
MLSLCTALPAWAGQSQCYGVPGKGRIEGAVQFPLQGENYTAYANDGFAVGRTHVHSTVAQIMQASYRALARSHPQKRFVIGEIGLPAGGRFPPHITHRNGLSVDFFMPVQDSQGRSVPVPTRRSNRYGYDLEFDERGRFGEYTIDFEAAAEHLYQLDVVAKAVNAGIQLVIFDPRYMTQLLATPRGEQVRKLRFMKRPPHVRHDDHYHVDFAVSCRSYV